MEQRQQVLLSKLNVGAQAWWTELRSKGLDYVKAGELLPLPDQGDKVTAFHTSCKLLYVREVFDALFQNIYQLLDQLPYTLCHLNGNSGVGKSAFLWYFIIRVGIEHPDAFIVYESEAFVWEFRGDGSAQVMVKEDYPRVLVLSEEVTFHLIDQKVDTSRPIGERALVAASPDEMNTKAARKLRTTITRYMPVWDRPEYDALVLSWRKRAEELPAGLLETEQILKRIDAAGRAYEWFGGIPRFLLVWDADKLTEEEFHTNVVQCLANTKLENIRGVLQDRGTPQNISWRLFYFKLSPGDFSTYHYTFCSEKVADLYAEYLVLENLEQLRTFIEASEPLPEYAALRGFVFEQYVIGQALRTKLMGMPVVDDVYCHTCNKKEDAGRTAKVNWIECSFCQQWYHMRCVRLATVRTVYKCPGCRGRPEPEVVIADGGLLLRYYDGDLEDALIAAGSDAVKYVWRPLKKNNAVFDFVLPPRTLGQITTAARHPSSIDALVKAVKALNAWRNLFDPATKKKDVLLLYLLPPSRFPKFGFQRYRQSGKVSQRAVAGVVQCKVAVPVNGTPYAGLDLKPKGMPTEQLDLAGNLESWEKTLECKEDDTWSETELVPLEQERNRLTQQGCVYGTSDFLLSADFRTFGHPQLQAICKQLGIWANASSAEMVSELEHYVQTLVNTVDDMDVDS